MTTFHVDPPAVADEGDELRIQTRFCNRMRMFAPKVRVVATPNGGRRSAWEGMKAKREGMSPGFPDVACYWPGGTAHIEFKARNGRLSDEQRDWLNWLTEAGFPVAVCRSVDTAEDFVRKSGAPFL